MRIAWFTPFTPGHGIGDYSESITRCLAGQDDVTLFVPAEVGGQGPRPSPLPVVPLPPEPTAELLAHLAAFDVVVYNLGNHVWNHLAIYETAIRRPGIVVLHDLVMRDFFLMYFLEHKKDPAAFPRYLGYAHGAGAEALGRDVVEGRRTEDLEDPVRLEYPMYKPVLRRATGVIVHSEYSRARVAADTAAPVRLIEFPLFGPVTEFGESVDPTPDGDDGRVRLLTFGMLGPNKLIHSTIGAIAGSDLLRRKVRFTVIGGEGNPGYGRRLRDLVAANRLESVVELVGRRSDDELRAALAGADVVINLRNPHFGESSASLVCSLVAGVPTVVWGHGYYAEFPDDAVVKIRAEAELGPALERLVSNPGLRRRMGTAARAHAKARFNTDAFCESFRVFAEQVGRGAALLSVTDRVSDILYQLGSSHLDGLADRVAAELAAMAADSGAPHADRPTAGHPPQPQPGRAGEQPKRLRLYRAA